MVAHRGIAKVDSRIVVVVAAAFIVLCARPVAAGTIHVYEGESIQAAIDSTTDGDEIIVHPGTYYEAIDFVGKPISLHSSDGAAVTIIDATGLDASVVKCTGDEAPDTVLEGFTVRGGTGTHVGSSTRGGGMYIFSSSPTVSNCTFTANSADHGGALHCNLSSSPRVLNCAFIANSATSVGGGLYLANSCDPTVINCIFNENSAAVTSGGMHNYAGSNPTVINSVFSENTAQLGGGMTNTNTSNATVVNCTFSDNTANMGGGMRNYLSAPTVTNCVFWGDIGGEILNESSTPVVTYCDVQGGYAGEGNIAADPLFTDPENDDYRLAPGSPCIDAGNNTAVPPWILDDLDGNPRFVDDPDTPDTGFGTPPIVDMGAYEFQIPCPADINGDGTVDVLDLLAVIAAWGNPGGPEDINGDGIVDVLDLLEVIAAWGPCA